MAVAHAEPVKPAASVPAASASAGVTTNVQLIGSFTFGKRTSLNATFTNGTSAALSGQKGLITVAYGQHVDARLKPMTADPSKIVVERFDDGVWERLSLVRSTDGAVQAVFPCPRAWPPAPRRPSSSGSPSTVPSLQTRTWARSA